MTRSLAVIAAIVLAIGGCSGNSSSSGPVVAPTSPSASSGSTLTIASAAPRSSDEMTTPIPEALRYVWLGPARDIPALGGPQAMSIIRIRGARFDYIFGPHGEEALNSTVSVPLPVKVRLTSANATGGCHVGDEGLYDWSTATNGATMTMIKVSEACSPRAEAVVGAWVRAACKDFGCLGELEAGAHETAFFEPLGQPATAGPMWRMQYGQLSYTVPSGWANADDAPTFYNIVLHDAFARPAPDETAYPGISLVADAAVAGQDRACSPNVEPGVGTSPSAMAARIARIPGLQVSAPTHLTVAGRSATMLDVALKPGWSRSCANGPGVPVIRENVDSADGLEWRMTATDRWRVILVDLIEGRTMAIIIDSLGQPSQFDHLVEQAMPIVASFEVHSPTR